MSSGGRGSPSRVVAAEAVRRTAENGPKQPRPQGSANGGKRVSKPMEQRMDAADAELRERPPPAVSSPDNGAKKPHGQAGSGGEVAATADCPLCLELMSSADLKHPILCPTKCGFNFCAACINNFIISSKDDFQPASDGNLHVKVHLLCPMCRSDLSQILSDTLALRRADVIAYLGGVPDSELTASELRQKYNAPDPAAVSRARKMYNEKPPTADGEKPVPSATSSNRQTQRTILSTRTPTADGVEKEALEVHEHERSVNPLPIDDSLFGGLEFAMTTEEQTFITSLMTSGNAGSLAQAAQILASITEISLKGVTPSVKAAGGARSSPYPSTSSAKNVGLGRSGFSGAAPIHLDDDRAERLRREEMERRRRLQLLPARMPRFASIDARSFGDPYSRRALMTFADDVWDGSISDAFSRAQAFRHPTSGGSAVVSRKALQTSNEGVANILMTGGGSTHETHISLPRARVVICSLTSEGTRLGLRRGDVVTHLNSEPFEGDAEALRLVISRIVTNASSGDLDDQFTIVVNAEACTAEALRLRALLR